jgi:hypothetical protein
MRFSRNYTKLQDRIFTTVRDHCAYDEGQVIPCETPMEVFKARVLLKVPRKFKEVPECLLQYDTDNPELSAAEIIEEIRSLYRKREPPSPNDVVTVYLCERLRGQETSK